MLFSMNDFDTSDQVFKKSIEDFNKAVLSGNAISGDVWKFVYYNDLIDVVDTVERPDEAGRWDYPVDVIFELNEKNFCFTYYHGLTESQENEFLNTVAVPVRKVTKTVIVEEWEVIEDN